MTFRTFLLLTLKTVVFAKKEGSDFSRTPLCVLTFALCEALSTSFILFEGNLMFPESQHNHCQVLKKNQILKHIWWPASCLKVTWLSSYKKNLASNVMAGSLAAIVTCRAQLKKSKFVNSWKPSYPVHCGGTRSWGFIVKQLSCVQSVLLGGASAHHLTAALQTLAFFPLAPGKGMTFSWF